MQGNSIVNKKQEIEKLFEKYIDFEEKILSHKLIFLISLVKIFRPKKLKQQTQVSIQDLLDYLSENHEEKESFIEYMNYLLSGRTLSLMLTDAGILRDTDFLFEVRKRIGAKLLPYQPEKNTFQYVLNQVFYKQTDILWVKMIPTEQLMELFNILRFKTLFDDTSNHSTKIDLIKSISILTQRMSGESIESSVLRMNPEYARMESPFFALRNEVHYIQQKMQNKEISFLCSDDVSIKQIRIFYKQCIDYVNQAFKNSSKYGITLKVNQRLMLLRQQLERFEKLLSVLTIDKNHEELSKKRDTLNFSLQLIEYNCYKNNVTNLIKDGIQLISYEITQQTAKTGEHYIARSSKGYWQMFLSSMGAGLIVGFLCIFKVLAHKVHTSEFGHAFLYSLNYALGFILIYLLKFTLATKQPAMTATTIIKAIEDGNKQQKDNDNKHLAFAQLFSSLFRSQFIAFIGNVIIAFPVALLLIFGMDTLLNFNIVKETKTWTTLLTDASPIDSRAIFHAGIAGIFLFLSGIISGEIENSNKYNRFYYRIKENPWLKNNFGIVKTQKIAKWCERKWAGVFSNAWFGVFMGSCGPIGLFLGIGIDIRHITFVSGNIALGWYGSNFMAPHSLMIWAFIGMWLIGLMNFLVSFGLSLTLAFRSRNIPFSQTLDLSKAVWRYFKRRPYEFFFPILSRRR